jgi:hypothetical protein
MWDDSQRASGHFKIKFFKIVRSQKKFFYWDIAFEIRMFTLYVYDVTRYIVGNQESVTTSDICPFFPDISGTGRPVGTTRTVLESSW